MRIRIESSDVGDVRITDVDSGAGFEDHVLELSVYVEDGLVLADLTMHVDEMDIIADLKSITREER